MTAPPPDMRSVERTLAQDLAALTPEQRKQLAEICPEFAAWEKIKPILAQAERDFRTAYERTLAPGSEGEG